MASTVLVVVVSLCLGVLVAAVDGHSTSEATVAPSAGEMFLQKIEGLLDRKLDQKQQKLDQKLDSMQEVFQSSCGGVGEGGGSGQEETSANKLLLEAMQAKLGTLEQAMQVKLSAVEQELAATNTALQAAQTFINSSRVNSGSTFVRWGRKTCTNNSHVVYTGVAGGSSYLHSGAAANLLCLTLEPRTDGTPAPAYYAYLYGAEYEQIPGHHDHDVPCSVCLAAQPSTIMVPGTLTCPPGGWTAQYTGHLVAGRYTHAAASEYNCLDGHPEHRVNGHLNNNDRLLYQVITQCGSLPCPPYANGKVVTCVVCSK